MPQLVQEPEVKKLQKTEPEPSALKRFFIQLTSPGPREYRGPRVPDHKRKEAGTISDQISIGDYDSLTEILDPAYDPKKVRVGKTQGSGRNQS